MLKNSLWFWFFLSWLGINQLKGSSPLLYLCFGPAN
uniref:Uncharacterized protein n=1 Tax=Rhizophora mucronata TaxID=61149 RepID=A0A2P2P323_RHIMU